MGKSLLTETCAFLVPDMPEKYCNNSDINMHEINLFQTVKKMFKDSLHNNTAHYLTASAPPVTMFQNSFLKK